MLVVTALAYGSWCCDVLRFAPTREQGQLPQGYDCGVLAAARRRVQLRCDGSASSLERGAASLRADPLCACALRTDALCASALHLNRAATA